MKRPFRLSERETSRDARGLERVCAADGHPETEADPLVIASSGNRIHLSHFTDPATGFHGQPCTEETAAESART